MASQPSLIAANGIPWHGWGHAWQEVSTSVTLLVEQTFLSPELDFA